MQIFVPFLDIKECAKVLDYKRLGKQRVEAITLIRIISGYQILGWIYTVSYPTDENDWPNWCKRICQMYKDDKVNLLMTNHHENNINYYLYTIEKYNAMSDSEKKQYKCVSKKNMAWWTHVATLSWVGNLDALKYYYNIILQEWIDRGYKNTMKPFEIKNRIILPNWWFDERIHKSHRSKLYQKDSEHYKQFAIDYTPETMDYVWPRNQFTADQLKAQKQVKIFDL